MKTIHSLPLAEFEAEFWLFLLIPIAFLIVFPLIWCGVLKLLSVVSGWAALARQFPAGERPVSGEEHRWVTAMVGSVSYKRALTLHLAADGLFIETGKLFSIGHPRLFIPWSTMRKGEPARLFWMSYQRYRVGDPLVATMVFPSGLLDRMPVA